MDRQKPQGSRIGLALGGGGAKGLAHIGVLKVLEEYKIPIYCIAGSSVGAFIGGAYASGVPVEEMVHVGRKLRWSDLGRLTISKLGFRDGSRMEAFIRKTFPVTTFEELRIPFAAVATDICTGAKCVLDRGDLARAIRASCAIPGYFTPVIDQDNRMLVDGGIVDVLPVSVVKAMGAQRTIGVDVYPFTQLKKPPTNLYHIYNQAMAIRGYTLGNHWHQSADLLVVPNLSHIAWDDLSRTDEIIAAGEEAMRRLINECQQLLTKKSPGFFSRLRLAFSTQE
ncbi:MAG: patatin-like phospholipase family protein [Acidobacteria bacterium]|nr:patatin-like phospholipase family protein [Acidobacteriota bacterium]